MQAVTLDAKKNRKNTQKINERISQSGHFNLKRNY